MKVIVNKKTGEFGQYVGDGEFGFSSIPYIYPDTMTLERFAKFVKSIEGSTLKIEDLEVKNVEVKIID